MIESQGAGHGERDQGQGGPRPGGRLVHLIGRRLALVALLFVLLDVLIVVLMYARDEQTLAEDLIGIEVERVADALRIEDGRLRREGGPAATAASRAIAVFDASGTRVLADNPGSLPLPERIDVAALAAETRRELHGERFVVTGTRRVQVEGTTGWIAVAIAGNGFAPLLPALGYELLEHVALPLVPLSLLLFAFNLAVVRRMLVPLEQAVEEVNRLDPAQIGTRLRVPDAPDEVRTLLGAVNRALDRMESAFRLLQQFTADAAHELRTPLAVMTLGIGQLPASEARRKLQEDVAGMTRLVNQLLDLAQADALLGAGAARTDLHRMGSALVARMLPLAVAAGRDIRYVLEGATEVFGQPEILERALGNVVQNALAHTPPGTAVDVVVGPGPRISVRDHGPGIEPAVREHVFRRFWRAERASATGAGLGLAIALGVMEAHGGHIEIGDAEGGGATVSLVFHGA